MDLALARGARGRCLELLQVAHALVRGAVGGLSSRAAGCASRLTQERALRQSPKLVQAPRPDVHQSKSESDDSARRSR